MIHLFAQALTTRCAGIAGHQAQGFHAGGPFFVVVATPAWRAKVELPQVHHFMGQHRQRFTQ